MLLAKTYLHFEMNYQAGIIIREIEDAVTSEKFKDDFWI